MRAAFTACALLVIAAASPASATQVFITSGTSYAIPADWNNAVNTGETIGLPILRSDRQFSPAVCCK
jgi:hypothetical protein